MFFLFQNNVFSTALLSATVGEERCAITELQTGKGNVLVRQHTNWNSHIATSSILLMQRVKLHFLQVTRYEAFLNFANSL